MLADSVPTLKQKNEVLLLSKKHIADTNSINNMLNPLLNLLYLLNSLSPNFLFGWSTGAQINVITDVILVAIRLKTKIYLLG